MKSMGPGGEGPSRSTPVSPAMLSVNKCEVVTFCSEPETESLNRAKHLNAGEDGSKAEAGAAEHRPLHFPEAAPSIRNIRAVIRSGG